MSDRRPCEGCGNVIAFELTWCGGCNTRERVIEVLANPRVRCSECDEGVAEPGDYGMCGSCLHDAFRSGWVPGDTNNA